MLRPTGAQSALSKQQRFSTNVRTLGFNVDSIKRLACGHEQTVSLRTSEGNVAANLGQKYLSNALAVRREDMNSVIALAHPPCTGPDVSIDIGADAICATGKAAVIHLLLHRGELVAVDYLLSINHIPHGNV